MSSVSLDKVIGVLGKRHRASRTHFNANGVKTDARIKEVIDSIKKVNKTTA